MVSLKNRLATLVDTLGKVFTKYMPVQSKPLLFISLSLVILLPLGMLVFGVLLFVRPSGFAVQEMQSMAAYDAANPLGSDRVNPVNGKCPQGFKLDFLRRCIRVQPNPTIRPTPTPTLPTPPADPTPTDAPISGLEACDNAKRLVNSGIDASLAVQACVEATPAGGVVALPAGTYTFQHQVRVTKPLHFRTERRSTTDPKCELVDSGCVEFKADAQFDGQGGIMFFTSAASGGSIDHVIINGNKDARLATAVVGQCQAGNTYPGHNFISFAENFSVTNSVFKNAICASGFGYQGKNGIIIKKNTFAYNGFHDVSMLWADGATLIDLKDSVVSENDFIDNTDIDLIFGGCENCVVSKNVVTHSTNTSGAAFAALMFHSWPAGATGAGTPPTSGNYSNSIISENSVDCGVKRNCGFGLLVGSYPWYATPVFGGTYQDNTISNVQQGLLLNDAHTLTLTRNSVVNAGGVFYSSCGFVMTSAYAISPRSYNINRQQERANIVYENKDFTGCILSWWVPAPKVVDAVEFINQSVPTVMTRGEQYTVRMTMKNTGDTTWRATDGYFLGAHTTTIPSPMCNRVVGHTTHRLSH